MDAYALEHWKEAVKVVTRLRERGHEAYFAGGYFRDRFLGRRPNDVDVATSAKPEAVRALFSRTIPVGEQFGIVIVQLGDERVEVATFRTDAHYEDGRHPTSVTFASAEADAQRRDFTINGVFWDPIAEETHDFVGGQEDMIAGVVRAIGDPNARFDEDKLRILRAPRFAARLGFRIETKTHDAAKRRAFEVTAVSSERIRDELDKMIVDPNRARAIDLVRELDLPAHVLPELDADALARGRAVLAELPREKAPRPLAWAALLSGTSPEKAFDLMDRLRSSNADRDEAVALLRDQARVHAIGELRLADQKRLLLRPDAPLLLELARAVALATTGNLEGLRAATRRRAAFLAEKGPSAGSAPPLLKGNDLRDLGLKPGPRFKEMLSFAEDARLEGRALTREALVSLLRAEKPELFSPP
jgi:poly(A) polymerase